MTTKENGLEVGSRDELVYHVRAFTLVELLVVLAVITLLAALLVPALVKSKTSSQRVQCASSLHQFGLAAQMYLDDNGGDFFPYQGDSTNGGIVYWFGWLQNGAESQRAFDITQGALYSYIQGRGIEICPSLNYSSPHFKLKATGAAYGYGYDLNLTPIGPPVNVARLVSTAGTALLADAAQVNTFEAPASPSNPMLEEFYYVSTNLTEATAHFRHQQNANVLYCDSHVDREQPVSGSIDQRLPSAYVGRLHPSILTP
jgi:prepilin-type N-terminal cleavage/methylation domain-containing protein/prepilin-type processing-associated H-X9-DG protein